MKRSIVLRVGAQLGLALLVSACSGGDAPMEGSFRVPALRPANQQSTMIPGETLSFDVSFSGPYGEFTLSAESDTPGLLVRFTEEGRLFDGGSRSFSITSGLNLAPGSVHIVRIVATRPGVAGRGVSLVELRVPERYFELQPWSVTRAQRGESTNGNFTINWLTREPSQALVNMRVLESPSWFTVTFPPSQQGRHPTANLSVAPDAPLGRHVVRVSGEYAGVTETTTWNIDVMRGTEELVRVIPTRTRHTVFAGGTVSDSVRVQLQGGDPRDAVSLSLLRNPAGVTASFSPSTVQAGNMALMHIQTARGIAPGMYEMELYARRADGIVDVVPVTLEVIAPDFQVSVAPTDITIPAGTSARVTLAVQRSGFPDTLDVEAVTLPPALLTRVDAARLVGNSTTVDIDVPATTPPGTYAMWVRVRGAGVERRANYRVVVAPPPPPPGDFGVQVSTDSVSLPAGSALRVPITLSRVGRYTNQPLSLEARASGGFDVWVTPSRTTGARGDVQVVARATTAPGRYPVVVRALAADAERVDTLHVTVTPASGPDFVLVPEATAVTLQSAGFYAPGPEVRVPIIINRSGGFADAVSLTFPNPPEGVYLNITPSVTTGTVATLSVRTGYGSTPGVLVLTIRGVSGSRVRETQMTLLVP